MHNKKMKLACCYEINMKYDLISLRNKKTVFNIDFIDCKGCFIEKYFYLQEFLLFVFSLLIPQSEIIVVNMQEP